MNDTSLVNVSHAHRRLPRDLDAALGRLAVALAARKRQPFTGRLIDPGLFLVTQALIAVVAIASEIDDLVLLGDFVLALVPPPNPVRSLDNTLTAEEELGRRADKFEGKPDGWQCQVIKEKVAYSMRVPLGAAGWRTFTEKVEKAHKYIKDRDEYETKKAELLTRL